MAKVNGVVEAVSTKYGKFGVLVNGTWYNTKQEWANCKPESGDTVEFDDGGAKYFKNAKIVSGGSTGGGAAPAASTPSDLPEHYKVVKGYATKVQEFPIPALHPDRAICRQNALTNAVNYLQENQEASPEDVIKVAKQFEAYTTGDMDMEEAVKAKEALGG